MAYMTDKAKLKKIDELKQNPRFIPFVMQCMDCESNRIDDYVLKHFDYIVDNFELYDFLETAPEDEINRVLGEALKSIEKEWNI